MNIDFDYIQYAGHKIEVPAGTPPYAAIESLAIFYPHVYSYAYYIDDKVLRFLGDTVKEGEYDTTQSVFKKIFNQEKNSDANLHRYHTNPSSEIPEPTSGTIPEADDTGGYFIDGTAQMGVGNNEGGFSKPRIVGGEITQEAINDTKNQTITMIGDSLGVGTEPSLKSFSWKKQSHNNMGSRQWKHSDKSLDALAQLSDMLSANNVNQNVVMVLGTNRGVDDAEIDEAVTKVGSSRNLILVDTKSQVNHAPEVASAYRSAADRHTNVFYANWSEYAQDSWYGSDNIHMSGEGYKKHAEFITQAVYEVMNTDWSAGFGGALAQPTAQKYDKSKANNLTTISTSGWNLSEANSFRMNAADPPFINGDYINRWLAHNSKSRGNVPLMGHGESVKLMADYFGIAVGAALGIWVKETQWGKTSCGGRYNLGCRMWGSDSPFPKKWAVDRDWIDPPSIDVAVADWFKYARYRYVEQNLVTYQAFLDVYSPGFENDQSTFKNLMWAVIKSLGYDTSDTVSKRNYGSKNDNVADPGFINKVKQQATAAASGGAGGAGGGTSQASGSRFRFFPTTPSKSQINYGFGGYPGHKGMDIIYTDNSSDIYAIDDGVVTATQSACVIGPRDCGGGWGNHIRIKHSNGYSSLYAHLASLNVKNGQSVKGGQRIGVMGNTGRSDGKHLHLELWEPNDNRIDPEKLIKFTGYKRM